MALGMMTAPTPDPAMTPRVLTDVLAESCNGWGLGDPMRRKPTTILLYGYLHGRIEEQAATCDAGFRTGFCDRLQARKVDLGRVSPGKIDQLLARSCAAHPTWTLRDVAKDILADPHLGFTGAGADRNTGKH